MSGAKETYLGDGVYASFDGMHVWLRVGDDSRIALEHCVYKALVEYAEKRFSE